MPLTLQQKIEKHAETHSDEHMGVMLFAMQKKGISFEKAHKYALKKVGK